MAGRFTVFIWQSMIKTAILFVLVSSVLCITSSPVWLVNSNLKCGSTTLVNSATSSSASYPANFPEAFSIASPRCVPGIIDFSLGISTSRYFALSLDISNRTSSSYQFDVIYSYGISISSLKAAHFCYDNTAITFLTLASTNASYSTYDPMRAATGIRQSVAFVSFSTGSIDMTHNVYIMPFLASFTLDRGSPETFFSIGVSLEIFNSTGYNRIYRTTGTTSVEFVKSYRITYDQTAVQATQQTYLDTQFMVGVNSVPGVYTPFIFSVPENYFAGLNNLSFLASQVPEFTFNLATFSLEPSDYEILNVSTINYRYRSCVAPTLFYVEAENLCYDACPPGYYAETVNNFCAACYRGCLTCTDGLLSSCFTCNATANRFQSGTTCPCLPGFYDASAADCSLCSQTCATCLGTSANCTGCGGNRVQSGSLCSCPSDAYADTGAASCVPCPSLILGCLTCSASTVCTGCNSSAFRVLNGGVCSCSTGYFDTSVELCGSCSPIVGCLACSSATNCTLCDTAANRHLNGGLCPCSAGYTVSGGLCVSCASAVAACVTCNSASGVCWTCQTGFFLESNACKQICGDGILFTLACDDGNLQDGDGCSSTCTVEANYTCRDGSPTTQSKCSYNKPLHLSLSSSLKDTAANAVTFKIEVKPALKVLNSFDFSQIVSSNLPTKSMTVSYENGVITARFVYTQSIQLFSASITLSPPTSLNNTFAMVASATTFSVSPSNADAIFFDESQYSNSQTISILLQVAVGIGFTAFIIGALFWKIVGLETMNILQMLFFCVGLMPTLLPMFSPIAELNAVNGYNGMFKDHTDIFDFDEPSLPKTLVQMKIGARFIQNCNYMLIGEFVAILLGSICFLISFLTKHEKEWMIMVSKFFLAEILLQLVIFNVLNVGFSFGLHMLYFNKPNPQPASNQAVCLLTAITALIITTISCYLVIAKNQFFERSNKVFQQNYAAKLHPVFLCCYRLVFGTILGATIEFHYAGVVLLILQFGYFAYVCWRRPYRETAVIVRAIFNELTVLLIISQAFGYSRLSRTSASPDWSLTVGFTWLQIIMVLMAVCFNLVCILYGIYKGLKGSENKQVYPLPEMSQDKRTEEVEDTLHKISKINPNQIFELQMRDLQVPDERKRRKQRISKRRQSQ